MKRQMPDGSYEEVKRIGKPRALDPATYGTPRSVLAFIDAHLDRNDPPDPFALARELGYSATAIRKLMETHGENLVKKLVVEKRRRTEHPSFMAKQQGQANPEQYVSTVHGAIDDAETIDGDTQARYSKKGREQDQQQVQELLAAMESVDAALTARMKGKTVITGEMRQARAKIRRAKAKLVGQIEALDRAA